MSNQQWFWKTNRKKATTKPASSRGLVPLDATADMIMKLRKRKP